MRSGRQKEKNQRGQAFESPRRFIIKLFWVSCFHSPLAAMTHGDPFKLLQQELIGYSMFSLIQEKTCISEAPVVNTWCYWTCAPGSWPPRELCGLCEHGWNTPDPRAIRQLGAFVPRTPGSECGVYPMYPSPRLEEQLRTCYFLTWVVSTFLLSYSIFLAILGQS